MLRRIITHELRLLARDKVVWLIVVFFAAAIGYAVLSRSVEVSNGRENIKEWPAIFERNAERHKKTLIDIERKIQAGEMKDDPTVYDPRNPRWIVNYMAATVALAPAPLAVLAVGRSDLDTPAYKINAFGSVEPGREQTDYPLRSLVGHFDLAFVMLYLFPLFILGLSFNLISSEKETGTLTLLLSQPVSLRTLVMGKALARALIIFGSALLFTTIALLFSGVEFADPLVLTGLLLWLVAIFAYGAFWFGLALIVNLRSSSSASCALVLLIGWFALAILIPGSINLVAALAYPVPSRIEFIDARRAATLEISQEKEKAGERIDEFLLQHPEFPGGQKYSQVALNYMGVAQRDVERKKRLEPITSRFDKQLNGQRELTKYLSILSPLTVTQSLLPEIAGTGRLRHQSYLSQLDQTWLQLREFIWLKVLFDQRLSPVDYDLIPRFRFVEPSTAFSREVYQPFFLLVFQTLLAVCVGLGILARARGGLFS
jgi:ABC-2 type transport system permease protein